MADRKTQLMSEFYIRCQKMGYTDMKDSTQSLKAKVIATDLGLNYGNIVLFYEDAKKCHERVLAENERAKIIQQERDAQAAEDAKRRAVDGELILTLCDKNPDNGDTTKISVYIRPDNSIYSTINGGGKLESAPAIKAQKVNMTMASYEAPKAVYTGATVGGVATGGVHYTQGGYKYSGSSTGKGEVRVILNTTDFALDTIVITDYLRSRFKRDDQFKNVLANTVMHKKDPNYILCYRETERYRSLMDSYVLLAKSGNTTSMMNTASMIADERRLPINTCKVIADFLNHVVKGQFPPTDPEIYMQANQLSNGTTAADLGRAINLFSSIKDYSNAKQRADELRPRYEAILQQEKEQAVLNKEATGKKKTVVNIILNSVITVILGFFLVFSWTTQGYSTVGIALGALSIILSFPGLGLLLFRKKYGCLQRIIRWVAVAVLFFLSFGF